MSAAAVLSQLLDPPTHTFRPSGSTHTHTFFNQLDDVVDVEADLVRVLAGVLVQSPAAGPRWPGLGFGSREGSLSDAPLPLFPVKKKPKSKIFCTRPKMMPLIHLKVILYGH